jgi:hypothetical protein
VFPTILLNIALYGTRWQATSTRGKNLVSSCCSSFPLTRCAHEACVENGRENPFLEDPLQWIGTFPNNQEKHLNYRFYVDLIINRRIVHALVDFGALHKFLKELVCQLGLKVGLCNA